MSKVGESLPHMPVFEEEALIMERAKAEGGDPGG